MRSFPTFGQSKGEAVIFCVEGPAKVWAPLLLDEGGLRWGVNSRVVHRKNLISGNGMILLGLLVVSRVSWEHPQPLRG
jgi:hypothetical protein